MFRPLLNIFLAFVVSAFTCLQLHGQLTIGIKIISIPEECMKGSAALEFTGLNNNDSVATHWSTGETNVLQISGLSNGDHNVNIHIKHKTDHGNITKDTVVFFTIEKVACPLSIPRYFSPNGDLQHDVLTIGNISYYPNFEFEVFNKWGQRVHHQKNEFIPWDGKWLGIDLPDGTYFFVLFYDASDKKKLVKGDITILR